VSGGAFRYLAVAFGVLTLFFTFVGVSAAASVGPASAYPTLKMPASICFNGPNEFVVHQTSYQRNHLNAFGSSSVKSFGCFLVAKCPPVVTR
jgi:hypothetical protein